jgi:hypothetical protein
MLEARLARRIPPCKYGPVGLDQLAGPSIVNKNKPYRTIQATQLAAQAARQRLRSKAYETRYARLNIRLVIRVTTRVVKVQGILV